MAFNINSSINMKSINKVSSVANNVAFKDKFYDDVEKGTYAEIDYSDAAGIDIQEGIEAAEKAREDRIKREQEEARRKAEEARLKLEQERQAKLDQLEDLYKQRDDNNGLFHPIKEAEIEEKIRKLENELSVPHKPDGWESFCNTCEDAAATAASYTVTAVGSVAEGFVDLGEGVVDSLIYGAGELGIVDKDWAYDVIAYDVSAEMYEGIVNVTGIDKDIAYGTVHTVGNVGGKALGYLALSSVPYVGTALCMQAGAGSSVEKNLQEQMANNPNGEINDWEVRMSAGLGALEGWGAGKAATAAKTGFNTIKGIGWNGAKEAGKSTLNKFGKDVIVNTIKDNGKTMVKNAAISTFTELEFYAESAAMVSDDIKTGIKTGEWDILGMAGEVTFAYGSNFVGNLGGEYFEMADEARRAGASADSWSSRDGITDDIANTAESNFREHSSDYTSKSDYYNDLDRVEGSSKYAEWVEDPAGSGNWKKTQEHVRINETDPGITDSVTQQRKNSWNKEIDSFTNADGKTTVHVGNTSTSGFEKYVLGKGKDYGTLGVVDDVEVDGVLKTKSDGYQFVSMGDGNSQGLIDSASGTGVVRQFEKDLGLPEGKSDRMVMVTYDVDRSDIGMPTGKEIGSNKQRLPGGRTPNGNLEAVHQTIHVDSSSASSVKVDIIGNDGSTPIWTGTLSELKDIQLTDPARYKTIMGL